MPVPALLVQARILLAKYTAGAGSTLPAFSVWHLCDASPHATLLFSSVSTQPRDVRGHGAPWRWIVPSALRTSLHCIASSLRGHGVPLTVQLARGGEQLAILSVRGELCVMGTTALVREAQQLDQELAPIGAALPETPLHFVNGCVGSGDQWMSASWWDDRSLLLVSRSGAVSVSMLPQGSAAAAGGIPSTELVNRLGSPEVFRQTPALSLVQSGRFFVLERRMHYPPPRRPHRMAMLAAAASEAAGSVAPPSTLDPSVGVNESPSRVQSWHLYSIRQTSPEQLFHVKVQNKEYAAALEFAQAHGMSADPVRQAQWLDAEVSQDAIRDYLEQVESARWVLEECCRRVPDEPEMVEQLLRLGMERCRTMLRVERRKAQGGPPVQPAMRDATDQPHEPGPSGPGEEQGAPEAGSDPSVTGIEALDEALDGPAALSGVASRRDCAQPMLPSGDSRSGGGGGGGGERLGGGGGGGGGGERLSVAELEGYFVRLHRYDERLQTSRELAELAEDDGSVEGFDPDAYRGFRDAGVYELAMEMAELERFEALRVLFERHASELEPLRLDVLGCVPETAPLQREGAPSKYCILVERLIASIVERGVGDASRDGTQVAKGRDAPLGAPDEWGAAGGWGDWGEEEAEGTDNLLLGELADDGIAASLPPLDRGALVKWFHERAIEIDERSGQLDFAADLLTLGIDNGLAELQPAANRARQLHMLVYDLDCEEQLSHFESLGQSERLQLLLDYCPAHHPLESPQQVSISTALSAAATATSLVASAAHIVGVTSAGVMGSVSEGDGEDGVVADADGAQQHQHFDEFTRTQLLPFLRMQPNGGEQLREHMVALAGRADDLNALPRCAALVHASRHLLPPAERLLRPIELLIETVLRCVYACPRTDGEALELMTRMYKDLPTRGEALAGCDDDDEASVRPQDLQGRADRASLVAMPLQAANAGSAAAGSLPRSDRHEVLSQLLDALEDMENHLSVQHRLREYGLLQAMGAYRQGEGGRGLSAEHGNYLLRRLARQTARRMPPAPRDEWTKLKGDMRELWRQACSHLPEETPHSEWMQALLLAGHFRLAADHLRGHAANEPLDPDKIEALVLASAREYFNAATSADDASLDSASECLRVVPQPSATVLEELRLIEAVRSLARLGCSLLPLQVRLHPDRLQILIDLIETSGLDAVPTSLHPDASVSLVDSDSPSTVAATAPPHSWSLDALEQLATDLGSGGNDARNRVCESLASMALRRGDVERALELTKRLVVVGYGPAWRLCVRFCESASSECDGSAADLDSVMRGVLLAHVLNHCPHERFDASMALWRTWRAESAGPGSDDEASVVLHEVMRAHAERATEGCVQAVPSDQMKAAAASGLGDNSSTLIEAKVGLLRRTLHSSAVSVEEVDYAIALIVDQPSIELVHCASAALNEMIQGGAHASDAAQVQRVATVGAHAFGLLVVAAAPTCDGAPSVADALQAETHAQLLAYVQEIASTGYETESQSVRELLRASCEALEQLDSIVRRLAEAQQLLPLLPSLNVARYATDDTVRTESVRLLASSTADGAFEQAIGLAAAIGLDQWELHMACVQHALTRPWVSTPGDDSSGVASPRTPGGSRTANTQRDVESHEEALLAQPARLSRTLATEVFTAVPFEWGGLLKVLTLMLDCENQLRRESIMVGSGSAPASLLDHNSELLLQLRTLMQVMRCAVPDCDPRSLLHVGCQDAASAHVRLTACAAPHAATAWRHAVTESNAPQLALLAPLFTACLVAGTDGSREVSRGCSMQPVFSASSVWAVRARAVLLQLKHDGAQSMDASYSSYFASVLPRLSAADMAGLLLAFAPHLDSSSKEGKQMGALMSTACSLPLQQLCDLLRMARRELCARAIARMAVSQTEALDDGGECATQEARLDAPSTLLAAKSTAEAVRAIVIAQRQVIARLAQMRLLAWLHSRASAGSGVAYKPLVAPWLASDGCSDSQLETIIEHMCCGSAPVGERVHAARELLPQWLDSLKRQSQQNGAISDAAATIASTVQTLPALLTVASKRKLHQLCEVSSSTVSLTSQVLDVISGGGQMGAVVGALDRLISFATAAELPPPICLLEFARNESRDDAHRLTILQLLHRSPSDAVTDADVEADVELMLRIHARSIVRVAWPSSNAHAHAAALACVSSSSVELRSVPGVQAAFIALCGLITESDGSDATATVQHCQLEAIMSLLAQWRAQLAKGREPGDPPLLHAEAAKLLHLALQIGGEAVVVKLHRCAAPCAPLLTLDEEDALVCAMRQRAGNEGAHAAIERACTMCALMSGWPELESQALATLGTRESPAPDEPLLQLLIQQDHLACLAREHPTTFWPRALLLLTNVAGEELPDGAIAVLGAARLYDHAGSVVLHRRQCHPALHMSAAKLAMLRAHVQERCEAVNGSGVLSELHSKLQQMPH